MGSALTLERSSGTDHLPCPAGSAASGAWPAEYFNGTDRGAGSGADQGSLD